MKIWLTLITLCGLTLAIGCGGDDDDGASKVDCDKDMTTYNDVSAFDKCVMCHSSDLSGSKRMSAPADINFDTFEDATATKALKAQHEAEEGAMPPKDSGITITDAQRKQLITWYECGAKE
jgi:uncharacterized membrane protein